MTERTVYIKILAKDGTTKTVDTIANSLKKLRGEIAFDTSSFDASAVKAIKLKEKLLNPANISINAPNLTKLENGLEEIIFQLTELNRIGGKPSPVAPRLSEAERAANKAAQMVLKLDNQLAKLKGNDTELAKLNRQLAQPGVSSKIDDTTKAILRQKAALIDAERASNTNNRKPSGFTNATFLGNFGGNIAASAVTSLTSAFTEGGKAVLDYSSKLEQTKIGFSTLLGSGEKANALLKQIQDFAKSTPFEFAGIAQLSQRLAGANVEADKIIPLMRDIGNVVAATGETSQERLEGVTVALTQVIGKQKLSAEEAEQFAERGINAYDLIAKATGKTQTEVRKLGEAGALSADVFVQALQKVSRENFGDAMEKQSRTFSGALSNIKDTLLITANTAFEPLYEKISEVAARTAKEMEGADFGSAVRVLAKNAAQGFGEALAAELKKEIKNYDFKDLYNDINLKPFNDIGASFAEGLVGDFNLLDYITNNAFKGQSDFVRFGGIVGAMYATEMKKEISKVNPLQSFGDFFGSAGKVFAEAKKLTGAGSGITGIDEKLKADKAAKEAKTLEKVISDLGLRIKFYGDESQVAATKQSLISQGITNLTSASAKQALALAAQIDALKERADAQKKADDEAKKRAEDYKNELESVSERLKETRENAEFELQFANPTKLQEFDRYVKQNAGSFKELKGQISETRQAIINLQQAQAVAARGDARQNFVKNIQDQIREFEQVDTQSFQDKVRQLAANLNLTGIIETGVSGSRLDVSTEYFAENVTKFIDNIKALGGAAIDTDAIRQKFTTFLESFKSDKTNQFGAYLQVFETDKIPEIIDNLLRLANAQDAFKKSSEREVSVEGYKNVLEDLNRELTGNVELTKYAEIQNLLLGKSYEKLTATERDNLLSKAAQVDALKSARESYEQFRDIVADSVDAFIDGGFKGLFDSIKNQFKRFLADMLTQWITSKFFKSFGGGSGASSGGFSLSNIFGGLLGGGGSIFGRGTTPGFNPNASGGGILGSIGGLFGIGSSGGSNALTNLTRNANGTYSTVPGLLQNAGGGGLLNKIGGAIPFVGLGLSIGLPLISKLFGRNSLRKKEEQSRTAYLQTAFDALKEYDSLISDTRNLKINPPESALERGNSLASQIREQYLSSANSLTDKKTRNIALKDVSRIDSIVAEKMAALKNAVLTAQTYGRDAAALVPVFADGGSVSRFARQFGYQDYGNMRGRIPGSYDRKDDKLIRVTGNEVVLTPNHWKPITNYLSAAKVPGFADGGYVGSGNVSAPSSTPIVVQNTINVTVSGELSDEGREKLKKTLSEVLKDSEVQTKIALANALGTKTTRGNPIQNAPRF